MEFQGRFPDEAACREYLFRSRRPDGFRCRRCASAAATALPRRPLGQCSACRYQVSVTAGSVLHRTRTPLHLWFWAAYLVTTGTPGISALQLQRQLGLSRYGRPGRDPAPRPPGDLPPQDLAARHPPRVSAEHLQVYLDEFTFRFNRRRTPMAGVQTLLGLGGQTSDVRPGHTLPAELTGLA